MMDDAQNKQSTVKVVVILVLIAVATAVLVSLLQVWLLGNSNAAITGGVVGAVTAGMAVRWLRKPKG